MIPSMIPPRSSATARPQLYGLPHGLRAPVLRAPDFKSPAGRPWLITIVDLITLLLTFFVLLFSMSHVEPKRYQALVQSYGEAFSSSGLEATGRKLPRIAAPAGDNLGYLQAVLKTAFAANPGLKDIEFRLTPQYLMLTLPVTDLFMPGSGGFAENAKTPVFDLSGVLSNLKNRIAVVGTAAMSESDKSAPAQAGSAIDVAAWDLAIARATAMAQALASAGYDQPVTVLGRGGAATDVDAAMGRLQIMIMPERPAS